MNELKLFQSPIFGQVRTVVMNGQVMFAATDVAKCLGYANPQKAIRNHCKSIGVNEMDTPTNGGIQKVRFITKGNVVRLVASSELPQAEQVESWIFDEVIPTVLETGGYISTTPNDTPEEIMARALTIAQATLAKREERLKQLEAQTEQQQATIELQDKEIKEAAPKVNYYNNHLQSVNTLTSTQIAKQIGMDAEKLHKKTERSKRNLSPIGAMAAPLPLLCMGIALYPYTDVHTFGRLDRNQHIHCMDGERQTLYHCLIRK